MPRKILDKVTVTGADNSIDVKNLIDISRRFPFVEFGILLSRKRNGSPRFPSVNWLRDLEDILKRGAKIQLSGHICGYWVRNFLLGGSDFFQDIGETSNIFQRFQLNFHAERNEVFLPALKRTLMINMGKRQIILQHDGINDFLFNEFKNNPAMDVAPLFDLSGGEGILPPKWLTPISNYCGYAGGLSPNNLEDELGKISEVVGDRTIWIDAETHLRSQDNSVFEIKKVVRFLEIAQRWVK